MSGDILRATILGCGSSGGVPRLGGEDGGGAWGKCDPTNPKNRRRRCALLVERIGTDGMTRVLVDAGADVREQLLSAKAGTVDAVLVTHEHADHTHGIDDLRPIVLNRRERLDIWADPETGAMLKYRFAYVFEQPEGSPYPPIFNLRLHDGSVMVNGAGGPVAALAHVVDHGPTFEARGFRFGGLAYTPDVSALQDDTAEKLADLDVWIVDALRWNPHPTHAHVDQALEWIAAIKPKRAILTNLHNDLDYEELSAYLPDNVEPAWDGMQVEVGAGDIFPNGHL